MRQKLSIKQRVICGIIAVCTGLVYLGFCLYAVGGAWQRKEGDLPAVSPWLQDASLFLVSFPFGFLPGFDSILLAPILNALLWSTVAGVICVCMFRRRVA
ncbi:MAG: hypothetical protein WD030_07455 [Pirellulales bacterium]